MSFVVRILLITPYYFPYINPRAHRWTSIAEDWAKQGHEVHVICSKRDGLKPETNLNKVHVHRTGYNSLKELFYNLFKSTNRRGEAQKNSSTTLKRSRLMTLLVWFNETFWKKIYFPDDACVWYFPARKKAIQLLKAQNFDCLVTVSLPFTTHLVGKFCKKRYPKLDWIVDIGDPFSLQFNHQLNNHILYKKVNIKTEENILQKSEVVSVTTEGTKQLFLKHFEIEPSKIHVIPPLRKKTNPTPSLLNLEKNNQQIHIGYFGSFFKNIREPNAFLDLIRTLIENYPSLKDHLVVHFFGDIIEHFLITFEQYNDLADNIHLHGLVSREQISAIMQQMDFLLNISNSTSYQLPSKSVDYLASGKPIINVCSIKKDLFKSFFEPYPIILNLLIVNNEIAKEHVAQLVEFIETNKGKNVDGELIKGWIEGYEVPAISQTYLNVLSALER